jgi:TPR repeat protein
VNASKSNVPAESSAKHPLPAAAGANPSIVQAKQFPDAGKAELAAGLAYLNGDNGKRDIDKALQQLWKAVANGNAEAEVILADLYATGDGVPQNCEQAQVLLRTATKAGDAQARVKLEEIVTSGCQ